MSVPLKDINELMIEENPVPTIGYVKSMPEEVSLPTGFNKAIKEQGQRKIGLNREKLAAVVWTAEKGDHAPESEQVMIMEQCYRYADLIIARESELLEWKP